jgi:hypothetical protein
MISPRSRDGVRSVAAVALLACLAFPLCACTAGRPGPASPGGSTATAAHQTATPGTGTPHPAGTRSTGPQAPLPAPATLTLFGAMAYPGEGRWYPAGRLVDGMPAVYETTVLPPGGTRRAGLAWMDARLLSARLYSGSLSPGGGPYKYTAPVAQDQAKSLVAAFNGGFKMADAHGGYYTEGHLVDKLVAGDASLVIYADGSMTVGAWGTDVTWSADVVAVRQNLVPLVTDGEPTALAFESWKAWGNTCGAHSCAASVPGIAHQWRSGLGVTANGALVYAVGPALDPLQLAELLVRAGAIRAMELDINPNWPVFASYRPAFPGGLANSADGSKLLAATRQGPWTFFTRSWARDFITLSALPSPRTAPIAASPTPTVPPA